MPSAASAERPRWNIPRESARCASIGCSAPSIRHSMRRASATDTGAAFSAISRARARAASSSSLFGWMLRTRPPSSASRASNTRPVETHSMARLIPTTRGRNQLEHASGTIPRRTKTNPIRVSSAAIRTSIGSVMVAPMPTAAPLMAAITGLVRSKIRSVSRPPLSRGNESGSSCSRLVNVSPAALEVGAGAEGAAGTGHDHRPHLVVRVGPVERL